ncbi:MAG: hypothetical protein L3J96_03335 [Thermoplasmata archaeon]|nr:hypothetical protein [Thermoplasmata archaeon]
MDRGWTVGWLSSTFVLALSVLILALPVSTAVTPRPVAGKPATESPPAIWAFSGAQVVNQSTSQQSVTVSQSGQYTWATVLSERSTGPFGLTLLAQRGMLTQYQYRLCSPSCTNPSYELQATINGHEWSQEFLNYSLQSALSSGGTAVGLVNASVVESATLNATSAVSGSGIPASSVAVNQLSSEQYSVAFSPSAAIAPTNPSAGTIWSSASTTQGVSGHWSRSMSTVYTGLPTPDSKVTTRQNLTSGGSFSRLSFPIGVTAGGQFQLIDGVMLTVPGASLFGSTSVVATGVSENTSSVDYDPTISAHLGIAASALRFAPTVAAPLGSAPAPAGAAVAGFEPPVWTIQSLPEPVSSAEAFFTHAGWIVPSATAPGGALPPTTNMVPLPLIVGVAAVIGIAVALGIRWRSEPERPLPNSASVQLQDPMVSEPRPIEPASSSAPVARDPFDDLL